MNDPRELRQALIEFLERDFVGPAHGLEEVLEEPPAIRYLAGVLFPQESRNNESDAAGGVEGGPESPVDDELLDLEATELGFEPGKGEAREAQDVYDEGVTLANRYRPSAMAASFLVEPPERGLVVEVAAATYESRTETVDERERTMWHRLPVAIGPQVLDPILAGVRDWEIAPGLRLRAVGRPREGGRLLVTLSVYNSTMAHRMGSRAFFQVGFAVRAQDGRPVFVEYRNLEGRSDDPEELSLEMLYRERRVFAIGHGCAANWVSDGSDRATELRTASLPSIEIAPVVPRASGERYLSMQFLTGDCADPDREIPNALRALCREYEAWTDGLEARVGGLESRLRPVARLHVESCREALSRMHSGIELLESDERSMTAFMAMNRAMLMQQYHSRLRRKLDEPWVPLPGEGGYRSDLDSRTGYWRPFQLAFLLMVLPGLVNDPDCRIAQELGPPNRELVDLIWFPTGGGKTEAYLGASAFSIFRGRLDEPERNGCRILMRYTLRLLTSQQFQRAASLVCACELIRRASPERFGTVPISIGLWVGMSLTPNDEREALNALGQLSRGRRDAKNPFQLLSCPWCGTEMDNRERLGYLDRNGRQVFVCPSRGGGAGRCPFSEIRNHLPICVVDESIYRNPPTLLIGTVDKFAMLAWRAQAGSIFEVGGGPDVVIQDELHLISGPLGSIMGAYEGIIDYLCSRGARRPKIIASTATIRHAGRQARALFDRELFQFPPPGLEASDSFFAIEDASAAGRIYLGLLPTAASSPLTAQIRAVVAMQQGLPIVAGDSTPDAIVDPYWTLVQYYSSLRELGRAATFITSDIPEFLPTMHRRYGLDADRRRYMKTAEELTSRKDQEEIPKILKRLEVPYSKGAQWDDQALDTVLATNMISVGVDVERLGLMMVVTQPKSTAEYIQASSRVGRSRRSPGLILTLYNASRPRDRSHYEQFRGFHEAFYREVEPTSVTPFAVPSLERVLHAVLVIAGRQVARWGTPRDFNGSDPGFLAAVEFVRERARRIDPEHFREFEEVLARRLEEWEQGSATSWGTFGPPSDERVLMRVAGTVAREGEEESWEALTSMRNVDVECGAEVVSRYGIASGGAA